MFTIRPRRNRTTFVALTTIVVLAIGGAAFAYWTSTGSGAGTGKTGTSTDFAVASAAATGPDLKPGVGVQSVAFTVNNPSTSSQTLTHVAVTVANADGSAWSAVSGCSAADFTVGTAVITYADMASGATANGTVTLSMVNSATNQDACKDAIVPLYFLAS